MAFGQSILLNELEVFMVWKSNNEGGGDFFQGLPSDLKPVTIVAQALDNQWLPNTLLSQVMADRKALKDFIPQREKHVRREFLRSLLNAENVVANRAYLFNNHSIVGLYEGTARESEAFQALLETRVLIPFLFSERSPHEAVNFGAAFDRDRKAFESWQAIAQKSKPSCIRLSWPAGPGNDVDNGELIRSHLARPFHDYGVIAKSGKAELYAQHLKIDSSKVPAFRERLKEVSKWFFDSPDLDDGSQAFRQRNDFYKQFVVMDNSPVHEGWYDPNKPFAAELKRLVDLKYNTNLADAIGRYALTPIDSLARLALQEDRISSSSSKSTVDAEALVTLLRRIMADLVQRQLNVPFLDSVSLQDIIHVRNTASWRTYVDKFGDLLSTTSSWGTGGIPFLEINTQLQEVFENYSRMTQSLADSLRNRHHESAKAAFSVSYGISLSVLGQVIAWISPGGGILFTTLAELVKPHLPVERPAQIVCKLFFRDPTRSDVLELEADMLEAKLPHAREEFSKLLVELKLAGFVEDFRTSLGEEEAQINVGRAEG